MVVTKNLSWLRLLVAYRGTELPRTKWRVLGVGLSSIVVTFAELHLPDEWFHSNVKLVPFSLMGVALSIFLGFRNSAAYDRWWEGRKLWGSLVNTTRSFTRQALTLVGEVPEGRVVEAAELETLRRELVYRTIAFTHALRLSLRDDHDLSDLRDFLSADEVAALQKETNRPFAITRGTAQRLKRAWSAGLVHPLHVPVLEASLTVLTDIQGGCERIKNTPIPFSYTALIHRIVAAYCYGLSFGLVAEVGWLTPIFAIVVSYAFLGLDSVGDEIEQPFGTDANDLPLSTISRMIEVNLRQALGEGSLPPMLTPIDDVLT